MRKLFAVILRNKRGATAIEYGLLAALIAVASVGAFQRFAGAEDSLWSRISNESSAAMN